MKRVLIISYYWPPSGGAGVQRWLKFVKYLRGFGWEPVVYTPENPESPAEDQSLVKDVPDGLEVIKTRIWEPYSTYKKFVGREKDDRIKSGFLSEKRKPSFQEKLSVWIRGNLFIPDARKFWIKPSIRHLTTYLEDRPVDAMVSTGPPHSMHLIARALKAKYNVPWIADFRDPWTNIDFYGALRLTRHSDRKHHRLEREVLSAANRVIVVSQGMAKDFTRIHSREYTVITNGYDGSVPAGSEGDDDEKFTLAHIGSMVPSRNPESLWLALQELCQENPEFRSKLVIKLVGQVDHAVRTSISDHGLAEHLVLIDYLPHDDVARVQMQASVLLLIINNTPNATLVVTGKLFEYIRSGRPVLCIGPTGGDAATILLETNTGIAIDHSDVKGIKMNVLSYFIRYKDGKLKVDGKGIEKYSRKNLTGELAAILDSL